MNTWMCTNNYVHAMEHIQRSENKAQESVLFCGYQAYVGRAFNYWAISPACQMSFAGQNNWYRWCVRAFRLYNYTVFISNKTEPTLYSSVSFLSWNILQLSSLSYLKQGFLFLTTIECHPTLFLSISVFFLIWVLINLSFWYF